MTLAQLIFQVSAAMRLLEASEFAEALPILEKACAAREPEACYLVGRTLFRLDRYEAALAALRGVRDSDPQPWRVDDAIAQVLEAMGQDRAAESAFRAAVKGNNDQSPIARVSFGRFLTRQGRAAEAVGILESATQRFPRNEAARFELGRALYQLGRLGDAEIQLLAAPNQEAARLLLAKVRRQLAADPPPRP